jgi:hypothetical protein
MPLNYEPPALFVNWQDAETRSIFPVGRLLTVPGGGYEFAYIAGVNDALKSGFEPFAAFPKLDQVYYSAELPGFFRNRLLQDNRPDYPQYLKELGLASVEATPVQILARSGGRRVTDPLEVFAELMPADNRLEAHFFVRGIRYREGAEEAIAELNEGDELQLLHEMTNSFNPDAHLVLCHDGRAVGYVPDYLVDNLQELIKRDPSLKVRVVQVNPSPAPSQQRLLAKLSISNAAPRPHRGPRFEPISSLAVRLEGPTPISRTG